MNVGIMIVATGKYIDLIGDKKPMGHNLIKSINDNFLVDHNKAIFVFTDSDSSPEGTTHIKVDHQPWPYPTLHRFHFMTSKMEIFENLDYVFYIDADSKVVGEVGDEILGDLVVCRHCSNDRYARKNKFPFEKRKESTAYFDSTGYQHYFTGAFNGGKKEHYLKMIQELKANIDIDHTKGIIAAWHDESHLNCYCFKNPPTVILNEGYNYRWDKKFPYPKKIVPVKGHEQYR